MADPNSLFPPSLVLARPQKKKNTSTMSDALKVEDRSGSTDNKDKEPAQDALPIIEKADDAKIVSKTTSKVNDILLPENPPEIQTDFKENSESVSKVASPPLPSDKQSSLKGKQKNSSTDEKREALTRRKNTHRTNYIIDAQLVKFIEEVSLDLKYAEITEHHPSTLANELLDIGVYLYKQYKKKVNGLITSGEQIKEFTLREFKREFNIFEE